MKRKILALMCVTVITAGMLAGCGNADKSDASADTADRTEQESKGQTAVSEKEAEAAADEKDAAAAGFSDGTEEEDSTADDTEAADTTKAAEDTAEAADTTKAAEAAEDTSAAKDTAAGKSAAGTTVLDTDEPLTGIHHAEITVKDYGTIELELDADTAPVSVTNFVKLAQENFYDGLTFHRIMDGFMIQGGDPKGDGTGGSEETIKGEFSNNGVTNDISHTRGTISMARSSEPDSASSQFFIVQTDSTFLDGDYAGFGHVTEGMDIVDQICKDVTPTDDNGTVKAAEQPVIETVKITD